MARPPAGRVRGLSLRIHGGEARGRVLHAPRGIRPTSGQVVEAIFNILGDRVDGVSVLDLFAGSGALGLEALSRGASDATFVDVAEASTAAIRRNLAELGYEERGRIVKADAARWTVGREVSGLVLMDPPYSDRALDAVLRNLDAAAVPGTIVVVEHEHGRTLPELGRMRRERERRYGDTALSIFEVIEP